MFPFTQITKKNQAFVCTIEAKKAFKHLKEAFTSASFLAHINPENTFTIEAHASDFSLGNILSQLGEEEQSHSVAFHARIVNVEEINYKVHDKELLAVVESFEQWRHFLEGLPHQIIIYSDQ